MPKVSVIVSVHNSEAFLAECVDSILGQDYTDLELIAVDDASTDGSRELLEKFAARDPRMQVVQLDRNLGAGGARNAALDIATGDYVWVIDSDDWIIPGALSSVVEQLEKRESDVLLFGWDRVYPDGSRTPCIEREMLERAPASFRLREWPEAIHLHHMPWNKVVKRELLKSTDFRFPPGWHQDIPYTYTMLLAAKRISALPENLVVYRQHAGAATFFKSSGHLCVIDQWSRAFEQIKLHGADLDELRQHLVDRMLWHVSEQLKKQDRLPAKDWPVLARRAQALWRREAPRSYRFPRGTTGLKYRMIAHWPALVPLIPRYFAGRRAIRRSLGLGRAWDLAPPKLQGPISSGQHPSPLVSKS